MVLIDVDNFKSFNDDFGHTVGDAVLYNVASMLKGRSRSSDLVSRYGGEEFAVILPNTDLDGACLVAERFRDTMERATYEDRRVTLSVGVAAFSETCSTHMALLDQADRALYAAKRRGRNLVVAAPHVLD